MAAPATRSSRPSPRLEGPGLLERLRLAMDSDIFYTFIRQPIVVTSFVVTVLMVLAAIFAPLLAPQNPFNPAELRLMDAFAPPGTEAISGEMVYWLGADGQGRDVFSAILYGSRISLS